MFCGRYVNVESGAAADRELVRHSLTEEDRALALVSMITGECNVKDWLEELDRRLGSENFKAIAQLVLTRYRIQSHLSHAWSSWRVVRRRLHDTRPSRRWLRMAIVSNQGEPARVDIGDSG